VHPSSNFQGSVLKDSPCEEQAGDGYSDELARENDFHCREVAPASYQIIKL